jgi:glycosyltransferase involved in cell wall biosynthesis
MVRNHSIGAYVVTIGEPTTEECIKSLKKQSLPLKRVEIISNVKGIHNASNQIHDLVGEDYFLRVDADMVLDRKCVEILYKMISKKANIALASGMLKDDLLGNIWGIHMFKSELIKPFRYPDSIGSDLALKEFRERRGYELVMVPYVLGEHKPYYNFDAVFQKFEREGQKIVFYKDSERLLNSMMNLSMRFMEGDKRALWALNAITIGFLTDDFREKDYSKYFEKESYGKLKKICDELVNLPKWEEWFEKIRYSKRLDQRIKQKIRSMVIKCLVYWN